MKKISRDKKGFKRSFNNDARKQDGRRTDNKRQDKRQDLRKQDIKKPDFKSQRPRDFEEDGFQLEGRNPVLEALNHDKTIDKIFVKKGEVDGTLKVIVAKALEKGIIVQEIDKMKMEQMKRTNNPQGIIALCPAHEYCEVSDILENAKKRGEDPFVIILDEITDPHNLGAIIRTADAAGAHGVIIPKRRAVSLTATVSRISSGALEYVPVARVNNITKEIEKLKKAGLWIACTDMKGTTYFEADLKGPIGLVIGNEGEGVSRLIKESCDFSIKIPMFGHMESLNASVASGVVMYEVVRQRKFMK